MMIKFKKIVNFALEKIKGSVYSIFRVLPIIILLFGFPKSKAQSNRDFFTEIERGTGTRVNIIQDKDIRQQVNRHIWEESKNKFIYGFRIRIYSNSGAKAGNEAKSKLSHLVARFPDVESYLIFDYPFYRVYMGDFRTRSEALKFLKSIELEFPDAFIVPARINYPSLNEQ